jgi:hypothetical protein
MSAALSLADPVDALNLRARAKGWTFTCERGAKFDCAKLTAACALWQSQAAPGRLPARPAFTARLMKDFLPELSIMEIVRADGANRFRHRLMGTGIVRYMSEMTGMFLDEYLPQPALERTLMGYQTVIDARCPLRFVTQFTLDPISYLSAEIFAAPLSSNGVTIDMMMSVTDFRRPGRL